MGGFKKEGIVGGWVGRMSQTNEVRVEKYGDSGIGKARRSYRSSRMEVAMDAGMDGEGAGWRRGHVGTWLDIDEYGRKGQQ